MAGKSTKNTRNRIVQAAWDLFYELGFEDTTVENIIFRSKTSKGSFYHYFNGKDALLGTLSSLFDQQYEALEPRLTPEMSAMDKLLFLNNELFSMVENKISIELLAGLLSTQLRSDGEKHLLDHRRTYYRLLRKIIIEGQEKKELTTSQSASEMVKLYALCERALMYDWCLCGGEYSLKQYSQQTMPVFLHGFLTNISDPDTVH